ncbi:MAG: hypothetical protein LBT23_08420 [Synergistaceae bacterium]|nr:hypothetical protein [Synergistaceae bacterium]
MERKRWDALSFAAWMCALISAFALPWSGAPLSAYLGVGSWLWFPSAAASLSLLKPGDGSGRAERRLTAILNTAAIMAALYLFMLTVGVPGDIPGIEGPGSITSLEGIVNWRVICALTLFFVSSVLSFAPARGTGRASSLLSFSYASFLSLIFVPPAHIFAQGTAPARAIVLDVAAYFCVAEIIHILVLGTTCQLISNVPKRHIAAVCAAMTATGAYFLSSSLDVSYFLK